MPRVKYESNRKSVASELLLDVLGANLLDLHLCWLASGCSGQRTRGKGLLQLLGLLHVVHNQGVEVTGAAELELGLDSALGRQRLLHPRRLGIGAAGNRQKVLNIRNLLGLWRGRKSGVLAPDTKHRMQRLHGARPCRRAHRTYHPDDSTVLSKGGDTLGTPARSSPHVIFYINTT